MKKTLFVNLFGGPSTGKSTLCASIFSELKRKGVDCEMALEYVKDLVWEESFEKIKNQVYIFGKQQNRLFRLDGKVDVVITDSPLLNSIVYYKGNNPHFSDVVMFEFKKLNSLNYYLVRTFEYVDNGRMQSLEQAKQVDRDYKELIEYNKIEYAQLEAGITNLDRIVNDIMEILNNG
jgi:nicotinamide riboside kinase